MSRQCFFNAAGAPRRRVTPNRLRVRPLAVARTAVNASSPTASVADPPALPRGEAVKQAVNRPQKVGSDSTWALAAPSRESAGSTTCWVPWPRKRQAGGVLCTAPCALSPVLPPELPPEPCLIATLHPLCRMRRWHSGRCPRLKTASPPLRSTTRRWPTMAARCSCVWSPAQRRCKLPADWAASKAGVLSAQCLGAGN